MVQGERQTHLSDVLYPNLQPLSDHRKIQTNQVEGLFKVPGHYSSEMSRLLKKMRVKQMLQMGRN